VIKETPGIDKKKRKYANKKKDEKNQMHRTIHLSGFRSEKLDTGEGPGYKGKTMVTPVTSG